MVKLISKKGLNFLILTIGLLGNNIINVKADDCTIFKTTLSNENPSESGKFANIGDCCTSNFASCEKIKGENHITEIKLSDVFCYDEQAIEKYINGFENLQYLTHFEVTDGHLCSMPQNYPKLKKLKTLIFSRNGMVSSPLPENVSQITSLEKIDFSDNYLTGEIPESYGKLKNLKVLNLSKNKLTGKVPDSVKDLDAKLELDGNEIKGIMSKRTKILVYSVAGIILLCIICGIIEYFYDHDDVVIVEETPKPLIHAGDNNNIFNININSNNNNNNVNGNNNTVNYGDNNINGNNNNVTNGNNNNTSFNTASSPLNQVPPTSTYSPPPPPPPPQNPYTSYPQPESYPSYPQPTAYAQPTAPSYPQPAAYPPYSQPPAYTPYS